MADKLPNPQDIGNSMKLVKRPAPDIILLELFRELGVPASEWDRNSGLDLYQTPGRMVQMYKEELLAGYQPGAFETLVTKFTCFPSDGKDAMVLEGNIDFTSLCSHHLLPFTGVAHVAYVPGKLIVGASKLPRVVTHYSKMLQIQERMCRQVADFIYEHAKAKAVIVMVEASHLCMSVRGVKQPNTKMITTAVRPDLGEEENHVTREILSEFYSQLSRIR